ncbi:hypothetical protein BROUX41_002176 [Berkeleyomyces rouxiae]|uniref:uncharacterized protein n=1 Tax=Berkeleyomyces rouxiae TaxID=2035830 RepID=UPI003B7630E5
MVGKQWSPGEEKTFWKKIVPRSPKRLGIHRLNPEETWDHLAEVMQRSMGNEARRTYTGLSLFEHWFQNVVLPYVSKHAVLYAAQYKAAMSPEEKESLERRQDDRARRPRTTKAKRDRAALAMTKAREKADIQRRREMQQSIQRMDQGLELSHAELLQPQQQQETEMDAGAMEPSTVADVGVAPTEITNDSPLLQPQAQYPLLAQSQHQLTDEEATVQDMNEESANDAGGKDDRQIQPVHNAKLCNRAECINGPETNDLFPPRGQISDTDVALDVQESPGIIFGTEDVAADAVGIDLISCHFGFDPDSICLDSTDFPDTKLTFNLGDSGIESHDSPSLNSQRQSKRAEHGTSCGAMCTTNNNLNYSDGEESSGFSCSSPGSNIFGLEAGQSPHFGNSSPYEVDAASTLLMKSSVTKKADDGSLGYEMHTPAQHQLMSLTDPGHDVLQALVQSTPFMNSQSPASYYFHNYTSDNDMLISVASGALNVLPGGALNFVHLGDAAGFDSMAVGLPLPAMELHDLGSMPLDLRLDETSGSIDMTALGFGFGSADSMCGSLEAAHLQSAHASHTPSVSLMALSSTHSHGGTIDTSSMGGAPGGAGNKFETGLPVAAQNQIAHIQQMQQIQAQAHATAGVTWEDGVLYFGRSMV